MTIRNRWLGAGALFGVLTLSLATFALAQGRLYADKPARIAIEATPIVSFDNREPAKTRFGALEFVGGLALTSAYKPFGGVSALHVEQDGSHFLAVTDKGSWLKARIVYRGGKPAGIADAEMAPLRGQDGQPLAARHWYDSESLTLGQDGLFYVGIERVHKIVRFDVRRHGLRARGWPSDVPVDFKSFKPNKSLECLAAPPKGALHADALIAIAERSLDKAGNHRAFVLAGGSGDKKVMRFSVKRSADFDISDCMILPPGDLLLLERSYSILSGVGMRIRRVPLSQIKEGALLDGEPLIVADLAYQIDNMEGIAVHRNAAGETILTLVSDDNFSAVQRNLLLQFKLVE
jgi:hypothetical protein